MDKKEGQRKRNKCSNQESSKRWIQDRVNLCEKASQRLSKVKSDMEGPVDKFNQLYLSIK